MEKSSFLPEKYPDLAGSKPVERAVKKARREGETVPDTKSERIDAYLERLEDISQDERGFELLKHQILKRYVTKPGEITESYWTAHEKELRERGEGGDWAEATPDQKAELKTKHADIVLADQRASLEQWIDYFASSESRDIPRELKYWIFRNVLALKELVKTETQKPDGTKEQHIEFPKRSKGTVSPFPDLNHEALGYLTEAILRKLRGEGMEFEHDIGLAEREAFLRFLAKEDFAKLYAWANELHNPIPEHLLPITEGRWIAYPQNSEAHTLVKTIRGRGTGWCTAGENTASTQLRGGDFHVYYSLDDDGKPTIPRLAIRMEGDKIAEVRGVAYKQNLDPYMPPVLDAKLGEFGKEGGAYRQRTADMRRLTALERKSKSGERLTRDDLLFLYEIDRVSIEGFGYRRDPRIKELRDGRNKEADMPIVFDCAPNEIAHAPREVTLRTKVYEGALTEKGIFRKLAGVEHIYTSFPEGKLRRYHIELGGKSKAELKAELAPPRYYISDWANQLMESRAFTVLEETEHADLVRLTVKDLGFAEGGTTNQIYKKVEELGLELCPAEAGPALRLATDDPDYILIAMKQIADRGGYPGVFLLSLDVGGLKLDAGDAWPESRWSPDSQFVFLLRKQKL